MFGGLKEKLLAARNRLGTSIQGVATTQAPGSAEKATAGPAVPEVMQETGTPVAPSFVDKLKVFIIERELIVSEKDIAEALSESRNDAS